MRSASDLALKASVAELNPPLPYPAERRVMSRMPVFCVPLTCDQLRISCIVPPYSDS